MPAKQQKVILVTGASSGIGKDAALALLKRGHIVYGAARRVEKMQDIVKAGGHALAMDVTNEDQVVKGVKQIIELSGRIDVLVNNAGYSTPGAVEEVPIAEAKRNFDVNLFGLARLTQEVLPYMRKAKSGSIVNVSSVVGKTYFPFGAWYIATKHALEGWSDTLRLELHPFNIKVAIIEPGAIRTEFMDVAYGKDGEKIAGAKEGSPYSRYIEAVNKQTKEFESKGSKPAVISNLIIKASEARRPKRRYVAGFAAKPMLFMRNWFGDGVFDSVGLSMMKPQQ